MKPVLVTGGNRTGTSRVGEMLCLSEELYFVWEPFNCMFSALFSKHPLKRHCRKLLPEEIQSEILERIASRRRPKGYVLEDAVLCWKVFHQVIHQYKEKHQDWLLVRHEGLSIEYISEFRQDSASLTRLWKKSLTSTEKDTVQTITEPVAGLFYNNDSWS
ncbi:MAG: hypothetical protein KAH54_08015 [Candidatus Sabulitectum sp.]|nr:hypothetical protein [Candidatus Sabulitectum sp.]